MELKLEQTAWMTGKLLCGIATVGNKTVALVLPRGETELSGVFSSVVSGRPVGSVLEPLTRRCWFAVGSSPADAIAKMARVAGRLPDEIVIDGMASPAALSGLCRSVSIRREHNAARRVYTVACAAVLAMAA